MRSSHSLKPLGLVLAALLCASGVWLYANRILVPRQVSDSAAHGRPRGNLSDLYMHWVSARELFLFRHNPYSPDVTRQIQQGYYGPSLNPDRPGNPRDQRFAYPVYVTFLLAPTVHLPFEVVRSGFRWLLFGLTVATIPLWLRILRWFPPLWAQLSLIILTIGSLPVMQGLKLQQMTLLVAACVVIGLAFLVSHRPVAAGVALAFSTIKPQLVWLLLLWLTIWTLADWRRRYRCAASFLVTLSILCAAAEWYLPHWIPQFIQAMRDYPTYTDAVSTFDKLLAPPWSTFARALSVSAALYVGWRNRRSAEDAAAFTFTAALILAVTIIVIPSYALYNEVMLLPALLLLARDYSLRWSSNWFGRSLLLLTAGLLAWPWLSSALLVAFLSFCRKRRWRLPGPSLC